MSTTEYIIKYHKNTNYAMYSVGQKFGGQKFSADKSAENSSRCRKFCPPNIFVRRKFCPPNFCPIRYMISKNDAINDMMTMTMPFIAVLEN